LRRIIIYSRVSKHTQDTAAQVAGCLKYANEIKKSGDEIICFDEEEMTTRLPMEDRPKLMEMLEFVRKGDLLIIYSIDRLARTDDELIYIYKHCLIAKGIQVYCLTLPTLETQDIALHGWLSQRERTQISVRTKTKLRYKQDQMEKVGRVWYGFKLDEKVLQTREGTRTFGMPYKLIPEPDEYRLCLEMIRLRDLFHTYEEIADIINKKGHRTREGKPFAKMSVYRIIQRRDRYDPDLVFQDDPSSRRSESLCEV